MKNKEKKHIFHTIPYSIILIRKKEGIYEKIYTGNGLAETSDQVQ